MSVNRKVLSQVQKVAEDCADVTSSGKQFQTEGQQPKMLGCQVANSGAVNRRLDVAVAAGRAKPSATWKVGILGGRAKVRRCTAMEDLIYTGWPKKVSHYRESSLNRIKKRQPG